MSPTRSRQGELRHAEIIAIARELLVEGGLDGFAMRTIATRVGMRLGNLQYYFPTRDHVLEAVFRAEFANDLAALRATADEADLGRLAGQLIGSWSSDSGAVFLALASLAFHDRRYRTLNREIYAAFHVEICRIIRRIAPVAATADIANRAFLMTALLDGAALQLHATPDASRPDPRLELITQQLEAIATGECERGGR
jgi:AcrR family transcriptional regulator